VIDEQQIATRIASFPAWHYDFDLKGHRTAPAKADWGRLRFEYFMEPVIRHFGGSLEGKRVLDLGCNAGFFSFKAVEAGCDFVLGVDGRQMHVDQANLVFEVNGIDPHQYEFARANILEVDYQAFGPFDLVLCVGVLYHVNKPISLFEAIAAVNTDMLVIETTLSPSRGSWLELRRENLAGFLNAVDYELVMVPTAGAVISMAELFGYQAKPLSLPTPDAPVMEKYRYGVVQAFVCAKQADLSGDTVFEFRSLKSLHRDQDQWIAFRRSQNKKSVPREHLPSAEAPPSATGESRMKPPRKATPSRVRRVRRFFRVRLRGAVRIRLQRLRRQRKDTPSSHVGPSESHPGGDGR
jgi:SAM-dependent methyltransferase